MDLVMLGAIGEICSQLAGPLKLVGYVLWIFKVAIPVIIVIMGIMDLGKAVTASKDDEIKKAMKQLMIRLVAGLLIFFIPTLIMFVFRLITDFNDVVDETQFEICEACILRPNSNKCATDEIAD